MREGDAEKEGEEEEEGDGVRICWLEGSKRVAPACIHQSRARKGLTALFLPRPAWEKWDSVGIKNS